MSAQEVIIPLRGLQLEAQIDLPGEALGLVVFAHGSGSSRHSSRNQFVARTLQKAGLGTLLMDLLPPAEEQAEAQTRHLRFDIPLLAKRLAGATRWALDQCTTRDLAAGFFGSSTGAAAALVAAAELRELIGAVVSRGDRKSVV